MGSSCSVERTFLTAENVATNTPGELASRTIERAVGVCQWLKQNFIPSDEIGEAIAAVAKPIKGTSKKKTPQ